MTAVSPAPGVWLGFQLAATLQLPPLVLVQADVAECPVLVPMASNASVMRKH